MLAKHKFSSFLHLICSSKMNKWKCRHSLTGARLGETYKIPNFYKIFRLHFYNLVLSRQLLLLKTMLIVRIGEFRKQFEIYFLMFKKKLMVWWSLQIFKTDKKWEELFPNKEEAEILDVMKCFRISFEDCLKLKKLNCKFFSTKFKWNESWSKI